MDKSADSVCMLHYAKSQGEEQWSDVLLSCIGKIRSKSHITFCILTDFKPYYLGHRVDVGRSKQGLGNRQVTLP